jgi:hypothetical protein
VQKLTEDNSDRGFLFCQWALGQVDVHQDFTSKISPSAEDNLPVNVWINISRGHLDRIMRITRMPTKTSRLLTVGLVFMGLSQVLAAVGKDRRLAPHTEPDHCSLYGSDKCQAEETAAALCDFLASVYQQNGKHVKRTLKMTYFHIVPSKCDIMYIIA